jgi:hypothetical protein
MHVREWFARHCDEFQFHILVSQAGFPDYVLEDAEGKRHRVEAEYESGNFAAHGHSPTGCDFVLCWRHTLALPLRVLELENRKWHEAGIGPGKPPVRPPKLSQIRRKEKEARELLAALERVGPQREDFTRAIIGHAELRNKQQHEAMEPGKILMRATGFLIAALRLQKVDVPALHPYDLVAMIARAGEQVNGIRRGTGQGNNGKADEV